MEDVQFLFGSVWIKVSGFPLISSRKSFGSLQQRQSFIATRRQCAVEHISNSKEMNKANNSKQS